MKTVFVVVKVIVYCPVGLGAGVKVFLKEFVEHVVTLEVYEGAVNVADPVTEFLNVADDDDEGFKDIEMGGDLEPVGHAVDVLEGGTVLVCVTDDVEVLDPAIVLLDVRVLKGFVGEPRGLDEVVLEELILAVVVVEDVVVFVPVIVLETVDDADVVLELLDVTVLVKLIKPLRLLIGLAVPRGDPVDVLDPIERETVDDPELVFDGGRDLDIVEHPVLVFEVLILPVDVFVIGGVFDILAEDVLVRLGTIV